MILKYKNTIYEPKYSKSDNSDGLRENDFWINIDFRLKNDEIDFSGLLVGMSFSEMKRWNKKNKEFIDGKMKNNCSVTFIRRLGEIYFYPEKNIIEKKIYLYADVNKYYSILISKEEIEEICKENQKFIEKYDSN